MFSSFSHEMSVCGCAWRRAPANGAAVQVSDHTYASRGNRSGIAGAELSVLGTSLGSLPTLALLGDISAGIKYTDPYEKFINMDSGICTR